MSRIPTFQPGISVPSGQLNVSSNLGGVPASSTAALASVGAGLGAVGVAAFQLEQARRARQLIDERNFANEAIAQHFDAALKGEPGTEEKLFNEGLVDFEQRIASIKQDALRRDTERQYRVAKGQALIKLRRLGFGRETNAFGKTLGLADENREESVRKGELSPELAIEQHAADIADVIYFDDASRELSNFKFAERIKDIHEDAVRGELVSASANIAEDVAQAPNDEVRKALTDEWRGLVEDAEKEGAITKQQAAGQNVSFDNLVTARINERMAGMTARARNAAALGDDESMDSIRDDAETLPGSPRKKALLSLIKTLSTKANTVASSANEIMRVFSEDGDIGPTTPQDGPSLNRAYNSLRSRNVPISEIGRWLAKSGSVAPSNFRSEVAGLFDSEKPTFNIEEGVRVLAQAKPFDMDRATAWAGGSVGRTALFAIVGKSPDEQKRRIDLLQSGDAPKHMAAVDKLIDDEASGFDYSGWVKSASGEVAKLPTDQVNEMGALLRLEYLDRKITFGDQDADIDVAEKAGKLAGEAFLKDRNVVPIRRFGNSYYIGGPNPTPNFTRGIHDLAGFGFFGFDPDPLPRPDLWRQSGNNFLIPAVGDSGIEKILEYDPATDRVVRELGRTDKGFDAASQFIRRGRSSKLMVRFGHLARQEGMGAFPPDGHRSEFYASASQSLESAGLLDDLSDDQRKLAIGDLANDMARSVDWEAIAE